MAMVWKMLWDDHMKVNELFIRYNKGETSLVPSIIENIEIHSRIEEDVVYPTVAQYLPDWALEAEHDHEEVKDLISDIQDLEPGDPLESKLMRRLEKRFKVHSDREEKIMFPILKKQLEEESYEMGRQAFTVRQEILSSGEGRSSTDSHLKLPTAGWRQAKVVEGGW